MEIKNLGMDDVGRRIDHLSDLQMLWSWALQVETSGSYQSPTQVEEAKKLEIALELLTAHMQIGYSYLTYAREINLLPKDATKIVDDPAPWFKRKGKDKT